jgi:hypothetical protein
VLRKINPVQTAIRQTDGSDCYVIIEPIVEMEGEHRLRTAGVFKIYKDTFGDEGDLRF